MNRWGTPFSLKMAANSVEIVLEDAAVIVEAKGEGASN